MNLKLPLLIFFLAFAASPLKTARGSDAKNNDPDRVVGSVYGKSITADDIGLTGPIDMAVQYDARDKERWRLQERVSKAFAAPILDRFAKCEKIGATPDEIAGFIKTYFAQNAQSLEKFKKELETTQGKLVAKDLSDQDRAQLEKKSKELERSVSKIQEVISNGPPSEELAKQFINQWQIERALKKKYGGRVIFQQAGVESLDGRRKLYEEAEKNGDLKFDNPGVRWVFYHYANMRHTVVDDTALEKPWFFSEGVK